ncbi:MAG: DUF721 domain-containing protein [Bacteroidales bacterium]|nr:DUF721 domain-containing protein [Bacteroidales bacterium]
MAEKGPVRMERKEAVGMDQLIEAYIKEMKLASGLGRVRVFAAWDQASGAGAYTIGKYLKDNVLYCNISSSALRQQLYFRRAEILQAMNEILKEDGVSLKSIVLK